MEDFIVCGVKVILINLIDLDVVFNVICIVNCFKILVLMFDCGVSCGEVVSYIVFDNVVGGEMVGYFIEVKIGSDVKVI